MCVWLFLMFNLSFLGDYFVQKNLKIGEGPCPCLELWHLWLRKLSNNESDSRHCTLVGAAGVLNLMGRFLKAWGCFLTLIVNLEFSLYIFTISLPCVALLSSSISCPHKNSCTDQKTSLTDPPYYQTCYMFSCLVEAFEKVSLFVFDLMCQHCCLSDQNLII